MTYRDCGKKTTIRTTAACHQPWATPQILT